MKKFNLSVLLVAVLIPALLASGCVRTKELEKINQQQSSMIQRLLNEISSLNKEIEESRKAEDELRGVKNELQKRLEKGIGLEGVSVRMSDRGLIVTLLNQILFDSGKAELKSSARTTLDELALAITQLTPDNKVFVEGHTDSDPIKYSTFKSNWDLSAARALEVLHFFIKDKGLNPKQFVVSGYGEFNPVTSNDTRPNKSKNRRVDVLISPKKMKTSFPNQSQQSVAPVVSGLAS